MKPIRPLLLSILFAFGLLFPVEWSASACQVDSLDKAICASRRQPTRIAQAATPSPVRQVATPVRTPTAVAAALKGDSPWTAIDADDVWRTIGPGGRIWHKFDQLPTPHILEAWLDSNGRREIGFAIYGPDQIRALPDTKPVGRGTYNRNLPDHDLRWVGSSAIDGPWYALVTNGAQVALPYKIGYNKELLKHSCHSYWENIGPNRVYWTS